MKVFDKLKRFGFLILPATLLVMTSCLSDDDEDVDYAEWRTRNLEYITSLESQPAYQKVSPKWDPSSFVMMKWIKKGNSGNDLRPLDNSTIRVKYMLTNIEGDTIDSSYALTDSLYQCQPNQMVTGFWIATTSMNIGDSVTAVMPYTCGYGASGSGSIPPYSTLIFQIKLESIVALETLPGRL